jgi:hypothetical protein
VKKTTLTTSKKLKGRGESLKWCNRIRCGFQKDSSHLVQTKLCQWRCTLPGPKKTLRSWDCQTHQVTEKSLGLFYDGSRWGANKGTWNLSPTDKDPIGSQAPDQGVGTKHPYWKEHSATPTHLPRSLSWLMLGSSEPEPSLHFCPQPPWHPGKGS